MTEKQPQPCIKLSQLSVDAILPSALLQALGDSGTCPFSCQQLHKLADQIAALRHLGVRLKVQPAVSLPTTNPPFLGRSGILATAVHLLTWYCVLHRRFILAIVTCMLAVI